MRVCGVGKVILGKEHVFLVVEPFPECRVGPQRQESQVDHQGGEVVYAIEVVLGCSLWVLVVPVADLGTGFSFETRQVNAVVINQAQCTLFLDHHVSMLQVVVGDPQTSQRPVYAPPSGCQVHENVRPVEVAVNEFVQPVALRPVHPDDGIPISLDSYAAFNVLETH